jgi:hypothetical protein
VPWFLELRVGPRERSSRWRERRALHRREDRGASGIAGRPGGGLCATAGDLAKFGTRGLGAACQGTESIDCPETTACSVALPGSTCTCSNGSYRCAQLTTAAAVQAGIVGKWRGIVTTPGFTPPYPITLWIYPDGTYWPDCDLDHRSAFYYGGDGPSPRRKITVLSTAAGIGAAADIAIDFGYSPAPTGALSGLVVDATNLRFTFSAAWVSCGQPFDVNLTRY